MQKKYRRGTGTCILLERICVVVIVQQKTGGKQAECVFPGQTIIN